MRALLIDDHTLFRQGLRLLLEDLDDNMAFFDADSCAQALDYAAEPIDLVLLDLHMPGCDGMEVLGIIRAAFDASVVVVLSGEDDPRVIRRSIELGASGFVPKVITKEQMFHALHVILAGGVYLPRNVLRDVRVEGEVQQPQHEEPGVAARNYGLSGRQHEVLMKVVQGKANKVIARELLLSEGTVKAHLSAAFRALNVQNRTEAVYMAAKLGLTSGPVELSSR